eukprot:5428993-Prymnesium_polylepis.1
MARGSARCDASPPRTRTRAHTPRAVGTRLGASGTGFTVRSRRPSSPPRSPPRFSRSTPPRHARSTGVQGLHGARMGHRRRLVPRRVRGARRGCRGARLPPPLRRPAHGLEGQDAQAVGPRLHPRQPRQAARDVHRARPRQGHQRARARSQRPHGR